VREGAIAWETFNILRPYAGSVPGFPGIVKANANFFFALHGRPNPLCKYAVGGQADRLFSDFLGSD
jgi:hypothetical protein